MRTPHLVELARAIGRLHLARWLTENREQLAADLDAESRELAPFERVRVCTPVRPTCRAR